MCGWSSLSHDCGIDEGPDSLPSQYARSLALHIHCGGYGVHMGPGFFLKSSETSFTILLANGIRIYGYFKGAKDSRYL